MSSPNDPLTPQTPVIQVLAQIAFWEMKTEDERLFAQKHGQGSHYLIQNLLLLLKKFAKNTNTPSQIEIHSLEYSKTIEEFAQELSPVQVHRFGQSIPAMIRLVHQQTHHQGLAGILYNWVQRGIFKNPLTHWFWN